MSFLPPKIPASFIHESMQNHGGANQQGNNTNNGQSGDQTKKRKRISSVCTNCRRRKIKCNREYPCSNCVKAKRQTSCVYDDGIIHTTTTTNASSTNENKNKMSSIPENSSNYYLSSVRTPIKFDKDVTSNSSANYDNNSRKKSKTSSISSSISNGSNINGDDQNNITMSELDMLKQRLESIESRINGETTPIPLVAPPSTTNNSNNGNNILPPPVKFNSLSPQNKPESLMFTPPCPTPPSTIPHRPPPSMNRFQTTYNVSHTRGTPSPGIQLPPINVREQDNRNNNNMIPTNVSYSSVSNNSDPYFKTPDSSVSNKSPHNSISSVRTDTNNTLIGVNPYLDENETINFYEGYTSICIKDYRRINHGPFAWSSLMKKDKALSLLWLHICKLKEEKSQQNFIFGSSVSEINQENTSLVTSESNESEVNFKKKTLESFGYKDIVPYDVLKKKLKKELNQVSLPLGLTLYEEQVNAELQLVDRIHQLLPKQKVIWKSLDRFFSLLYPFMPFIDEYDFTDSISKIIGSKNYKDEKIKEIKVEKRLDLAYLGLLLIVLRLSYLSLFSNKESVNEMRLNSTDPSEEAQDLKYLIQNPIGISFIDTAHLCLNQFDIFRKAAMSVLQLAFYLQLYHVFAPEDGDDGDGADTYALNAMIVQMAYSLGLNRDPDNFPDVLNNKRENNMGRKIWHFMILTDIHHSYSFGNPRTICDQYFDTKLPFVEEGAENLRDKKLDNFVTSNFPGYLPVYDILSDILKLILNVSGKVKMSQLCKLLSEFETSIYEKYGTLSDCLNPKNCSFNHIYARNMPVKLYISLKSFLVSVYFHIFLYYEKKDLKLSYFYLKKIIQIAATDIMPHYFELLGNSEVVCDMVINPKLIQIIHKLIQVNLALILRVNFSIYYFKNQEDHGFKCSNDEKYYSYYKELCKFSSGLTRCAEVGVAAVSKLSTRYYYAWKVTKANNYLLKKITTMEFYDKESKMSNKLMLPNYSIEEIQELGLMSEIALSKLGKTKVMGDEFCTTCTYKNFKSDISTTSSETNQTPNTATTMNSNTNNNNNNNISSTNSNSMTSISDTRKYTNEFGLDFVNNEDIDKIWLQMITEQQQKQKQNEPNTPNFSMMNSPYGNIATPGNNGGFNNDMFDPNSFDILVDIDRLLNNDG
uniref:MRR1 n=1 Tax=Candida tropicalis TaxID=5482 RepID=A0A5C2D2U8_CANTR|nr:MRR1 [Candida tropicalis]